MNALWQAASEHVETQHPPDKKERDCRNYDVANPLSYGLWLRAIGHGERIAPGLAVLGILSAGRFAPRRRRGLLIRVRELQHAPLIAMPADNLQPNGQAIIGESAGH
jgi:hypothetical protein